MSGFRTHLLFYAAVAAALFYALESLNPQQTLGADYLIGAAVGALYSLLPDVDTPSSKIRAALSKIVLAFVLTLLVASRIYGSSAAVWVAAALTAVLLLLWLARHRGFMHTPLAGLLLSAPLALISPHYCAMAFLGYATHLFLDGRLLG